MNNQRGYFGIGIEDLKYETNVGTLFRSAQAFGASFIFTVGNRYSETCSDTPRSWRHIPFFEWDSIEQFYNTIPEDCRIAGIEDTNETKELPDYYHCERMIYLLGSESRGLSDKAYEICDDIVKIPTEYCLNVATAGSIVMYDRIAKN